ncbi:MAG TPA: Na+:solute symporter [Pyrinomonadaceae bacterium]|nr:Na+:solute symporter [Pyrinomonadaceae bacterium]
MHLGTFDIIILVVYFVAMIGIGIYVTRRASKNMESYFLGENSMPWWLLGVSNASAMWDITGTMWLVYILFAYGLKGVFLPWLWAIYNQIFDAVYLSKWVRRSKVRTGAEWVQTRFGKDKGGELARAVILLFALISVVGFISYDFQGMGKFCKVFLPWDLSPNTYAVLIMGITAIYVVLGGMLSVVLTDFVQFLLMALSSVFIAFIAMNTVSADSLNSLTPEGWQNIFFGWNIDLNWNSLLPALNSKIADDGWAKGFGLFFALMFTKGILSSMAGAAPNYDMQRILAAKSPKEASLMSAIVSICLVPRWILISGITLLGLAFITPQFNKMGNADFELVLPYVINNFLPAGLVGLILAGLLSAFMSTFSATVNAGAAYLVNDVYKPYFNPNAKDKTLVRAGYLASILVLAAGIFVGYFLSSINSITQWIVSGLFGGYTAANILKWYWWRLNGYGYFYGMLTGILCALMLPVVKTQYALTFNDLYAFPVILICSAIASVVGSLLTNPVEAETLKKFYRDVRPWGFWQPVYEMCREEDENLQPNRDATRDLTNCGVGIIWQMTLITIPVYVILRNFTGILISVLILVGTSIFLKKFWYESLVREEVLMNEAVEY